MARQNVGSPKFYINAFEYWRMQGHITHAGFKSEWDYTASEVYNYNNMALGESGYRGEILSLNPSSVKMIDMTLGWTIDTTSFYVKFDRDIELPTSDINQEMWFGILGHNLMDKTIAPYRIFFADIPDDYQDPTNWGSYDVGSWLKFSFTNNVNAFDVTGVRVDNRVNCHTDYSAGIQYSEDWGETMYEYPYNGWSLGTWNGNPTQDVSFNALTIIFTTEDSTDMDHLGNVGGYRREGVYMNSFGFGPVYTMPHSPELSIQLVREYDGIKNKDTFGGSTLTNINYTGPASWGAFGAWEVSSERASGWNHYYNTSQGDVYEPGIKENSIASTFRGRRVWDLSFRYLSDTDIFSVNELLSRINPTDSSDRDIISDSGYDTDDFDEDGHFKDNITESVSFFAQLIEKTAGGNLRFMFQPDSNNNSPDQFALCQLDMRDISFKQVAYKVYDIKLKIREVW